MSQTIQGNPEAMVESVARSLPTGARDDFRTLMKQIVLGNLISLSPGGNLLQIGGPKSGGSAAPVGVAHTVTGANGVATVAITNPANSAPNSIWHEVSYSPVISFTKGVVTRPATTDTNITIPVSGVNAFYRLRSSFDQKTWTSYKLSSTSSIDAGLVESSAIAPGASFNQTNFAIVNSASDGGIDTVTVNGTGGTFTPYTAVKGSVQSLRPSATIVGTELGNDQFVGFDGSQFHLLSTLAGVFPDDLEPVGHVVVGSGTPGGGGVTGGNGGRLTAI